jgi:hypothetical protein
MISASASLNQLEESELGCDRLRQAQPSIGYDRTEVIDSDPQASAGSLDQAVVRIEESVDRFHQANAIEFAG